MAKTEKNPAACSLASQIAISGTDMNILYFVGMREVSPGADFSVNHT